jgi:UDP-2,4-diacetamido-2,4,6-trideoxy-beta-L-altropyranose hydrolase
MTKIKILTEAGKEIGFGHLTRCTAIFEQLLNLGYDVSFDVFLKEISSNDDRINSKDWLSLPAIEVLRGFDVALIDSYLVTKDWLNSVNNLDVKLIQLDDFNRIIYPVNLIINPNVYAESLDYSNQTTKHIGGPDYLILRKPFRLKKEKSIYTGKPRLLITLGGSDYRNLIPKLIDWSTDLNLFKISIIAPEGIEVLSKGVRVLPLLDANSMANEIINSEVIISACGQTLHEIASINRSTIGIGIDIDQIPNHKFYNSINFIKHNLWWDQNELEEEVKKELIRLADSSNREKDLKIDFKVNKDGVKNVVNEIIKLL